MKITHKAVALMCGAKGEHEYRPIDGDIHSKRWEWLYSVSVNGEYKTGWHFHENLAFKEFCENNGLTEGE